MRSLSSPSQPVVTLVADDAAMPATLAPPTVASAASEAERWPRELRLLLGPEVTSILACAVDVAGGTLRAWSARQVNHQPSTSTVVQYRADVTWPDGSTTSETLVAATGDRIPDGAAVLDDGSTRVGVWRWPIDPALPGLTAALDERAVAALLGDLGLGSGALRLRVRAYRPGRRAVIESTGPRGRLFLKVVRPRTVEALHRTHRSLAARLPVPDSLGWSDDGVVVLPALPGRTLRELLRSGRSVLPEPRALEELLDRLPVATSCAPRQGLVDGAGHHARVIASFAPSQRDRVDELLGELTSRPLREHDTVGVHGDFYETQLLVERGRISGLLDVDTAGAGVRVDDLANLCAHLSVLALTSDRSRTVRRYGAAVLAHAEGRYDRRDLRTRIAAGVLALATGPFRVQERDWTRATLRRLQLAEQWLEDESRA